MLLEIKFEIHWFQGDHFRRKLTIFQGYIPQTPLIAPPSTASETPVM